MVKRWQTSSLFRLNIVTLFYGLTLLHAMALQPLDFEKPILELQRRLDEIREHSDRHDVDLDSEVEAMEAKIDATRTRDLR